MKGLREKIAALERSNAALAQRGAALEQVIKSMCRGCALRLVGSCDWLCRGRDFCDTGGLKPVDLSPQQEVVYGTA